jgi:gliding motility-associated-like protein
VFQPLEDTVYYVTIEDTLGCFSVVSRYEFDVLLLASVDVPDAFSPNGDSVNEMLFVEGWGIEKVLEFKIFNRWGEMVFETTNPDIGWDGTYKGQDQMADTYTYIVSVKPYIQEIPLTKQGFINLIR